MAYRSVKIDIDKIYKKIDKIAKNGRDGFQDYYDYIAEMLDKGQYGLFTQVLFIKYDFDSNKYSSIGDVRLKSWPLILSKTNTALQDGKYALLKSNNIYQTGLLYYKQLPITTASIIDEYGTGADIKPIVENGGVIRIDVLKSGKNYSTASTVQIIGGSVTASAVLTPPNGVRGGMILKVDIVATGSNHNQDIRLGTIEELDVYSEPVEGLSQDRLQKIIDNKTTMLVVSKIGITQSATFSTWNSSFNYDKNVLGLYSEAINYLI